MGLNRNMWCILGVMKLALWSWDIMTLLKTHQSLTFMHWSGQRNSKNSNRNCTEHRIFIHSLDDIQGFWEWILAMKVKNRCQLLPNQSTWRLHIIIWHENQAMWDLLQSKNHPHSSTKRAKIIDLTVVGLIQHGCRVPHRGDSPWLHTETFAELNQPQKKWWALIQANHS